MKCPICQGEPTLLPARIELDLKGRATPDWAIAVVDDQGAAEFHAAEACQVMGVRNGARRYQIDFSCSKTLMLGDILTVRLEGQRCRGCGGTGKFNDYARRRMAGETHGSQA